MSLFLPSSHIHTLSFLVGLCVHASDGTCRKLAEKKIEEGKRWKIEKIKFNYPQRRQQELSSEREPYPTCQHPCWPWQTQQTLWRCRRQAINMCVRWLSPAPDHPPAPSWTKAKISTRIRCQPWRKCPMCMMRPRARPLWCSPSWDVEWNWQRDRNMLRMREPLLSRPHRRSTHMRMRVEYKIWKFHK